MLESCGNIHTLIKISSYSVIMSLKPENKEGAMATVSLQ